MKKVVKILCAFLLIGLMSCELEDDSVNFTFVPLQITEVELPDAFELNQTHQISVTFLRPNSCVFFEGFDVQKLDTTVRNVVAIGSEIEEQPCAEVVEEVTTSFNFLCLYSETYTFKFWTGENEDGSQEYLEFQVPVNP